jgi:hypothetical protein
LDTLGDEAAVLRRAMRRAGFASDAPDGDSPERSVPIARSARAEVSGVRPGEGRGASRFGGEIKWIPASLDDGLSVLSGYLTVFSG